MKKIKKKRKNKKSGKFISIAQEIISGKYDKKSVNTKLKNELILKDIQSCLALFPKSKVEKFFFQNPVPGSYKSIKTKVNFNQARNVFKEFLWLSNEINQYLPQINSFKHIDINNYNNFS